MSLIKLLDKMNKHINVHFLGQLSSRGSLLSTYTGKNVKEKDRETRALFVTLRVWRVILTLPLRFISATLAYTLPVLAGDDGCDLVD